jgi:uncharacterized protein (TIGR02466 family)
MSAPELFDLFPTPLLRVPKLLDAALLAELVQRFSASARQRNAKSKQLLHSEPLPAEGNEQFQQVSAQALPHVIRFGELLLGEALEWTLKEMWVNVLEPGGRQALHNHANSFISGVIYLTDSHSSANTLFVKAAGSSEFVFNNTNARAKLGAYNAGKWIAPDASAGDMLLFPSYLLHEVPQNGGGRRVSLAFNAIPNRLDSWGYTLTLSR